jgi:hypothetical protein
MTVKDKISFTKPIEIKDYRKIHFNNNEKLNDEIYSQLIILFIKERYDYYKISKELNIKIDEAESLLGKLYDYVKGI